MKWFRSNIKHGTRLALVALAVQFALSFGHFHGIAAQAAPSVQSEAMQSGPSYGNDLRPAIERRLRDLRRYRHGECGAVCSTTLVTGSASRGIPVPGQRRRVRSTEFRSDRFSASRSPDLLTLIA
jgi:hypothetical protein